MKEQELREFIHSARKAGVPDVSIINDLLAGAEDVAEKKSKEPLSPQQTQSRLVSQDVLIKITDLEKTYYPSRTVVVPALQKVSLDIYDGEFVAVTGHSGSGKSTFLNLLGLIDEPTSGEILVRGKKIQEFSEKEKEQFRLWTVSMVFQFFNLLDNYTAEENIIFQLELQGVSQRKARLRAREMLGFLGLEDKHSSFPKDLSGGQQQRLAIGRALARESLFILADEPTAHLDRKNSEALIDLLKKVNRESKRTIILVTHEDDWTYAADRVVKLEDGKVISVSKPAGAAESPHPH